MNCNELSILRISKQKSNSKLSDQDAIIASILSFIEKQTGPESTGLCF